MSARQTITVFSGVPFDGTCKLTADQLKTSTNNTITFPAAGGTLATTDDVANAGGSPLTTSHSTNFGTVKVQMSTLNNVFTNGELTYARFNIGSYITAQINLNYMKFNTSSKEIKVEPPYIYQYAVTPRVNTFNPVFDASGNVCGMLWVYNSVDELRLKFTFPSAPDANTYYFASATIIKCPQ